MSLAMRSGMQSQHFADHAVKSPLCRFIGKLRLVGVWAGGP